MPDGSWTLKSQARQFSPIVFGQRADGLLALAELGTGRRGDLHIELAAVRGCRLDSHQRAWKVSLYLPTWTSSPSSRRWDSIRERLLTLPPQTRVLTGHGDETSIGAEAGAYDAWVARGH